MNWVAFGALIRSWFSGGGKSQKDLLIELLKAQSDQNHVLLTNHVTHLQLSLDEMVVTQKEIASSVRESSNTNQAIRATLEIQNARLAHIEGRMGI